MLALASALAGCVTPGTPTPGGNFTRCKDIDLSNVSVDPIPVDAWTPETFKPGFLHIHYFWQAGEGKVHAVGILYQTLDVQTVAFIVGPLPGFPDNWDPAKRPAAGGPREDAWGMFFRKLRAASESNRPGGVFCKGRGCGMPPDSPPPDYLGTASSGSSGTFAALPGSMHEMYAEAATSQTRTQAVATDATFATTRDERVRMVKDLARNTCHGVQAHLGRE